ncbi:MAG: cytidine/deoxycytidylate deaminase family protein [Synergistaceae bacterium]|jgi:dCMP deaminase|nr:cytidine/deoxycytidylate deaminase family protein [Synergistaceae bacterium]
MILTFLPRPDWDVYFMSIAMMASLRSTCLRRRVGAVLARDRQIVSTGYNGAPRGTPNCMDMGVCLREGVPSGERHEMCRGSHAENNAIVQAARMGIATDGATVYCTDEPCSLCTKSLLNAGIARTVYMRSYPDPLAVRLREEAGVPFERFPQEKLLEARECLNHLMEEMFPVVSLAPAQRP